MRSCRIKNHANFGKTRMKSLTKNTRIAVLMTCYNRRQKTLACLNALFNQELPEETYLSVYLVDDGSTDNTSEAVQKAYPQVKILHSSGSCFWNGGMRVAFTEATKSGYDYYLWLNDDTTLYSNTIKQLLEMEYELEAVNQNRSILVGSICDPETQKFTYGGAYRKSLLRPLKFRNVIPNGNIQSCDTMNGNCVLIPKAIVQKIGNLDSAFSHRFGDFDYGLRAKKSGFQIYASPTFLGECSRNRKLQSSELLEKIRQPKFRPVSETKFFTRRHGGELWLLFWIMPYIKLYVSAVIERLVFSRLHQKYFRGIIRIDRSRNSN